VYFHAIYHAFAIRAESEWQCQLAHKLPPFNLCLNRLQPHRLVRKRTTSELVELQSGSRKMVIYAPT